LASPPFYDADKHTRLGKYETPEASGSFGGDVKVGPRLITRRSALIGSLSTLFAAPSIVRATSIMPVSTRAIQTTRAVWNVIEFAPSTFGAIGDGLADDTAAMGGMFRAVNNALQLGQRVVIKLEPGNYLVRASLK